MSRRTLMRHFRRMARKGWRRRACDIQVLLKKPGARSHPTNYSHTPLSALYRDITGKREVSWSTGIFSHALKLKYETVVLFDNVSLYTNRDRSVNWERGLKEKLMRIFPVG